MMRRKTKDVENNSRKKNTLHRLALNEYEPGLTFLIRTPPVVNSDKNEENNGEVE